MDGVIESLRRPTSLDELKRLGAQVRTHAEMLDEESLSIPHIDYQLAQAVGAVLVALIGDAADLDANGRSLVGAAARYFVLTDDEASDLDADGLLDDAVAVLSVCEQLGRNDLAQSLR